MTTLLISPAATGKTDFVLRAAQRASKSMRITVVCVSSALQAQSARGRLAANGGALGVRIVLFDDLYRLCLDQAGERVIEPEEPVLYRLLRSVIEATPLRHYAGIRRTAGFIQTVAERIAELKAGRVDPAALAGSAGDDPRLSDIAAIYDRYQHALRARGWADRAGLGWLALEALTTRAPRVGTEWAFFAVDGFDSLSEIQIALVETLALRVDECVATATGEIDGRERGHPRLERLRRALSQRLGIPAAPLPDPASRAVPALAHLAANLFSGGASRATADGAIAWLEAPERIGEAREALRWVKSRAVLDGVGLDRMAVLARNPEAYRDALAETAAEFGLPVRWAAAEALSGNPAIVALRQLLALSQPGPGGERAFRRAEVVEVWRSPYFDWSALVDGGISSADADALDAHSRAAAVTIGLGAWQAGLATRTQTPIEEIEVEEGAATPATAGAAALSLKFDAFAQAIEPPASASWRDFCAWVEDLVGDDPESQIGHGPATPGLQVIGRIRAGNAALVRRDLAALRALKSALRALLAAEAALKSEENHTFAAFVDELDGLLAAQGYTPDSPDGPAVLIASVGQARGLPLEAVAILGLGEGEFPQSVRENALMRDADLERIEALTERHVPRALESAESEFFYDAITRPTQRLLMTRARLSDSGAVWEPSPFWVETLRLIDGAPRRLTSLWLPAPEQAASTAELQACLAGAPQAADLPADVAALATRARAATAILRVRIDAGPGEMDGALQARAAHFTGRLGPGHRWSSGQFETYLTCPFYYFASKLLRAEPMPEPAARADVRQLGSIYHDALADIFGAEIDAPAPDDAAFEARARALAGKMLDLAPEAQGFRPDRWWPHDRAAAVELIVANAIALRATKHTPVRVEADFAETPVVVRRGADSFRFIGRIDRIDQDGAGNLRVVDYKSGGAASIKPDQLQVEGTRLQIALYALAARDAFGLALPDEGVYWSLRDIEAAALRLSDYANGAAGAIDVAVGHAWRAVDGARAGAFAPKPPHGGCPAYCPAAQYCWHYRPR